MIESTGLLSIGSLNENPNSNGIFIYKDASLSIAYKVPGLKIFTMTNEERQLTYTKFRNIINQLETFSKGEGALYQLISQPNKNLYEYKDKNFKNNLIDKDITYKSDPIFLKEVINKNIKEQFKIFEENDIEFYDNYIIVRLYFNLKNENISKIDILKNIFLNDNKAEIKDFNDKVETMIETHNSKFRELKAEPLNSLEMINLVRKYFGYSTLKEIPLQTMDTANLLYLFPGKIELEEGTIKTEQKYVVEKETKVELLNKEKEKIKKIEKQNKKDFYNINSHSVESEKIKLDIDIIFKEILDSDLDALKEYSYYDKYIFLKRHIDIIIKKIKDIDYEKFQYFNKEILELYKYEKYYFKDKDLANNTTYLKVYSVNELPNKLDMFHGHTLHSMTEDYTITINFYKIPDRDAQIKMRRQISLEKVKMGMPIVRWFIPIELMQKKVSELSQTIEDLEDADFSRAETTIYLTLRSNSEKDIREKSAMGSYTSKTDLQWQKEIDNVEFHILKGAMPTGFDKFGKNFGKRNFLINSTNVAQLSPLISEEKGAKNPVFTTVGYKSLIGFNLNEAPAGHLSIQGSTGGGKSVLGNKLVLAYKAYKDIIITTEKGNSFTRNTLFFGGKIYKPNLNGNIKINPFVMPLEAYKDEELKTNVYQQMVAAMSQMCNNYESSSHQKYFRLLKNSFERNGSINTKLVKNGSITPTELLKKMKIDPELKYMNNELKSFEQYTSSGMYGAIFDGNEGLDLDYPMINIDYGGLNQPEIKDFVFKSLLQNVFIEMTKSGGNKSFFNLNDEFWDAISASNATGESVAKTAMGQIESFFRVARKLGGKIGVISQGISDIEKSAIKDAVINNIYHSFFTATSSQQELDTIKRLFALEDTQLNEIRNLSQKRGVYSEYFATAPYGESIIGNSTKRKYSTKFKYYPTPFEMALFTTHKPELEIYDMMYEALGESGDSSNVSQEAVIKAVKMFMNIVPNGIESNLYFQEKLLTNSNDHLYTFKQLVEERYGDFKNALKQQNWTDYLLEG